MPCKYLKIWQENLPNVLYVNQYGPTEATASCTYYVVNEKVDDDTVLPIGKPYDNYRVFLLNEDNTPTEQGKTGEICVTGPILALATTVTPSIPKSPLSRIRSTITTVSLSTKQATSEASIPTDCCSSTAERTDRLSTSATALSLAKLRKPPRKSTA